MKRGFTLVEMIVALMIFSIVVVVALAALAKIIDANKKAQNIHDAVANLSFTLESMTREMRTGSTFYCKKNLAGDLTLPAGNVLTAQSVAECSGSDGTGNTGVGIAFVTNRQGAACNLINAYEIVPNGDTTFSFQKAVQTACGGALTFSPVIDKNVVSLTKYYTQVNDNDYPLIFMKLEGTAGQVGTAITSFTLQAVSSPRVPL